MAGVIGYYSVIFYEGGGVKERGWIGIDYFSSFYVIR